MSLRHERWYSLLLLAYPRTYRHERGAEIRTTLEASQTQPGRQPPALREAASLLVGGLRTRARLAASGSAGRLWPSGLHLGALLLLLGQATSALGMQWAELVWARSQHAFYPARLLALLPVLAAVSVLRGRWRVGLVLTTLTAAVAFSPAATNIDPSGNSWSTAARYLVPVAIVGWLAWQRSLRQARSWLWLLVPVLFAVDATTSGYVISDTGGQVTWLLLPALLVGALAFVLVDPRGRRSAPPSSWHRSSPGSLRFPRRPGNRSPYSCGVVPPWRSWSRPSGALADSPAGDRRGQMLAFSRRHGR